MATSATTVCGESVTTTTPGTSGKARNAELSPAPGRKRPRYDASTTADVAMAPEKPATNEVQPVRNAHSGPYASRR